MINSFLKCQSQVSVKVVGKKKWVKDNEWKCVSENRGVKIQGWILFGVSSRVTTRVGESGQ